ncbi:CDP-alcohol phosphatidyltransferase [Desulfuromonas versatilis]|uniref:CDP-diacylglycerol--glycerol-3-phosphate 3-phosphatidyltransferase n=1 Tax=Desulfuromonas versatilis TaxID=2802975 RepID=A0ABM8HWP9_9BACT|nr:CDP-diacylglycerol--glycerol-3-phosphate 3-phosphatidyltransferase [Desulfuromonas versatilis]BCR05153.1 CDP-alcohol phosphatidyltransferase [Desulfuromonas versatilis]
MDARLNLPNVLTLSRILLIPVFLIGIIYNWLSLALALFVLAGLTDLLDGYLARRMHQTTALGAYLDPVADKLLMTVAFIALAATGVVPAWLAVVAVSKDLFISLGAGILYFSGGDFRALPSTLGKTATCLQMVTVAMALLNAVSGLAGEVLPLLFALTGALTVACVLQYIYYGVRRMGSAPPG